MKRRLCKLMCALLALLAGLAMAEEAPPTGLLPVYPDGTVSILTDDDGRPDLMMCYLANVHNLGDMLSEITRVAQVEKPPKDSVVYYMSSRGDVIGITLKGRCDFCLRGFYWCMPVEDARRHIEARGWRVHWETENTLGFGPEDHADAAIRWNRAGQVNAIVTRGEEMRAVRPKDITEE